MTVAFSHPPLPWIGAPLLIAAFAAAVLLPSLLSVLGGVAVLGEALALAPPWQRFHAAPAHAAFVGS